MHNAFQNIKKIIINLLPGYLQNQILLLVIVFQTFPSLFFTQLNDAAMEKKHIEIQIDTNNTANIHFLKCNLSNT